MMSKFVATLFGLACFGAPALAQQSTAGNTCIMAEGTPAEIVQACTAEIDSPGGATPKYRVNLLLSRAEALVAEGKTDVALADYAAAMKLEPANMDIYRSRGESLMKLQKYADAAADFTKALTLQSPGTDKTYLSEIYYARAKALRTQG